MRKISAIWQTVQLKNFVIMFSQKTLKYRHSKLDTEWCSNMTAVRFALGLSHALGLRKKLLELRRNPEVAETIRRLVESPPALVLSGGGGKGAYEIGCLKALRAVGIRSFSAIAGTSVGALNGALVAQGEVGGAAKIWRSIRYRHVLKAHPFGFVVAFVLRVLLAPMFLFGSQPKLMEAITHHKSLVRLGFPEPIALSKAIEPIVNRWLKYTAVFCLLGIGVYLVVPDKLRFVESVLSVAPWWLLLPLSFGFLVLFWWAEYRLHNRIAERFALFSNEPLQQLVELSVNPTKIRAADIPIYITLAGLKWVLRHPRTSAPQRTLHSAINYDFRFVPVYRDLRSLSDDDIRLHILQSAGLPEVFPRRVVGGQPVIDGGVADNTPILPVLNEAPQNLVVIYLEPKPEDGLMQEEEKRVIELKDRIAMSDILPEDAILYAGLELAAEDGTVETSASVASSPEKCLLAISPSRSLGGILRGTMNFCACKARYSIRLGYWDTLAALERGMECRRWPMS